MYYYRLYGGHSGLLWGEEPLFLQHAVNSGWPAYRVTAPLYIYLLAPCILLRSDSVPLQYVCRVQGRHALEVQLKSR